MKQVQTAKFLFMENKSKFTMEGRRTFIYGDFLGTDETHVCQQLFNRAGFALGWSCEKTTQGTFLNAKYHIA